MKKLLQYTAAIWLTFIITSYNSVAQSPEVAGTWEGKLAISGIELRIVFHIETNEEGKLTATLDSPDQGALGIPCGDVIWENDSLTIMVPRVGGRYSGLMKDKETIEGTWSQGPTNLPLNLQFKDEDEVEEINRPQEHKPPFPYKVMEVEVTNNNAGVTLAGTLTIPQGEGPFPGAVLVSGSGPQDRDESIMGHKPFLVIADHLTRQGIAVLRYDDRGTGASTGDFASSTSKDFAGDAEAAVDFLRAQQGINPEWVGIIGHSEGGLIAPMVAAGSDKLGFIVLLAGPGINGGEIIIKQSRLISEVSGISEEIIERNEAFNRGAFKLITKEKDPGKLDEKLNTFVDDFILTLPESQSADPQATRETLMTQLDRMKSPWFRFFLTYEPVKSLKKVKCPVLALNGEKDLQVPAQENLEAIEQALIKAKNKNYRVEELKGLNHLFQHAETGSPIEYARIEETFSEEALGLISDWILGLK